MPTPLIMVAPTGAHRSKDDHPSLPITQSEIVATAIACHAAGAGALHLHIRDRNGAHTLDVHLYQETLTQLAAATPRLPVQITTEAAGRYSVAEQLDCLQRLQPAWASVSAREAARDPTLAPRLYAACADNGTEVQHILYTEKDAQLLADWHRRGITRDPLRVLLVLGRQGNPNPQTADIQAFLAALPPVENWMLCAFGRREHELLCAAARLGGDVRVGFENSLTDAAGQPHADNAASVAALKALLSRHAEPES